MLHLRKEPIEPKYSFVVTASRERCLDNVFKQIENLQFPSPEATELVFYFDCKAHQFDNYLIGRLEQIERFNGIKLFISGSHAWKDNDPVICRRQRVIEIWEKLKSIIGNTEVVFGMEDDMTLPLNAFMKLHNHLALDEKIGFASGFTVGRWKKPIIGAWDITYNEKDEAIQVQSLMPGKGLQYIQGGGLYCFATFTKMIKTHTFIDQAPCLSVDVSFVESVVKSGYKAIVDWSIPCDHNLEDGRVLKPKKVEVVQTTWIKKDNEWKEN